MKSSTCYRALCVAVLLVVSELCGQVANLLRVQFGPLWPRALLESDKPTQFALALGYGLSIDDKVGLGLGLDFMWNRTAHEVPVAGEPGVVELTRRESSYMFPVYGFVIVDPISHFVVHPAARFDIGYASMIYNSDDERELTTGTAPPDDPDGYYFGWFIRPGIDGMVNIGASAAFCLGVDYQWANTRSAKTEGNTYRRRDMSGVGVKAALRLIF